MSGETLRGITMVKKTVLIIAAVAVVVVVCAAAVFIVLSKDNNKDNNDADEENTYWFFIDYGSYETVVVANGWFSAKGSDALDGFRNAMDANGISYDVSTTGFINEINGVEPIFDMTAPVSYSWSQFAWKGNASGDWEEMNTGINEASSTQIIFYFGIAAWETVNFTTDFEPDKSVVTQEGGPFAA